MSKTKTIEVLNVLQPGKTYSANREKYEAMKQAVLKVLPRKTSPGITVEELGKAVLPHLPQSCFPAAKNPAGGSNACNWTRKHAALSSGKTASRCACTKSEKEMRNLRRNLNFYFNSQGGLNMRKKIFVNIPVADLKKSIAFYSRLASHRTIISAMTRRPAW